MKFTRGFIGLWYLVGVCASVMGLFPFWADPVVFFIPLTLFIGLLPLQFHFHKKWIKEAHNTHTWERSPLKQFINSIVFSGLFGLVQGIIVFVVISLLGDFSNQMSQSGVLIGIAQAFLLNFVFQIRYLLRQREFLKKESKGFKYLSKVTQKKALQDLVSPHFLFNSLNTAASIIPDDKDTALKFVVRLTDLYDFILKNNENQLITLNEELEIVEKYGFLIQTRFGESFQVKLEIDEEYMGTLIPPLTLQNLVENAAKHNAVTRKKPLLLEIGIEGDFIKVKNNINPKKTFSNESTNLGLDYIQSQIQQFSNSKMEINQTEEDFTVRIPLIYPSSLN